MWHHSVFAPAILNQISNIYFENVLRFGADLQLMLSSWLLYLFLSKFGFGNVIMCHSMQMVIRTQKNKKNNKNTKQNKNYQQKYSLHYSTAERVFSEIMYLPFLLFFVLIDKKTSPSDSFSSCRNISLNILYRTNRCWQ